MSILNKSQVECCTRADRGGVKQPPYLHHCYCPSLSVYAESLTKHASLVGANEADDGSGVSAPPRRYKTLTATLSGTWTCHNPDNCDGATTSTRIGSGQLISHVDEDDGTWPIASNTAEVDSEVYHCVGGELDGPYDSTWEDQNPTGHSFNMDADDWWSKSSLATVNSKTSVTEEDGYTGCNTGNYVATGNNDWSIVLSNEDSEEDALGRLEGSEGHERSTLHEKRTNDYSFTVRTSKYALIAGELVVGGRYRAVVNIRKRPAYINPEGGSSYVDADGNPSEWTTTDDEGAEMVDEYIFIATRYNMVVPTTGTWEGDTHDIFYSDVTPLIALPHEEGWEYEIESYFVELALESD